MNTFKSVLNTTIGMISIQNLRHYNKTSRASTPKPKEIWMTFSTDISCSPTYLEQMAQECHELTKKRFGKTIQMFAPVFKQ
jgi:2-iminoacetate synthase